MVQNSLNCSAPNLGHANPKLAGTSMRQILNDSHLFYWKLPSACNALSCPDPEECCLMKDGAARTWFQATSVRSVVLVCAEAIPPRGCTNTHNMAAAHFVLF